MWYDTVTLFILGMCTGSVITYLALSKYVQAHIEEPTFDEHVQGIESLFEQDLN